MQTHLKTLARRAKHLWDKLDGTGDYAGRLYDQAEYDALNWALDSLGAPLGLSAPESRDEAADDGEDLPPLRTVPIPKRRSKVRGVPGEPSGRRYYPDGGI